MCCACMWHGGSNVCNDVISELKTLYAHVCCWKVLSTFEVGLNLNFLSLFEKNRNIVWKTSVQNPPTNLKNSKSATNSHDGGSRHAMLHKVSD